MLQEGGERAVEQSAGGGDGDPFQGGQVGVEAWAGAAEGASGHDLAPAGRHITDILEFFGGEWRSGHALPCLGLAPKDGAKFSSRCRTERLAWQSRSWPRLLVAVMDPVGDYTQILYNLASEQIGSLDMNGGLTRTLVNAAGQLTAVIDADGNRTQYLYDALGCQIVGIDPLGHRATTTYDAAGNVSTMTDADNREQVFHYDADNRLTAATWLSSTGMTVNLLTYTYDHDSNQLTTADTSGTYSNGYDAQDRLTSQTDPLGLTLTYYTSRGQE